MEYQGVVQRHSEKPWQGKVFYSFALSGQDGWFGTGVVRPPAVGLSVVFSAKTNPKGFLEVDTKTIEQKEDGDPKPASVNTATKTAVSNGSGGGYWEARAARDVLNDAARELGACRNTALTIIDLFLKHEAVPLPKTASKREEYLWTLLDKYTAKLMGKSENAKDAPTPEQIKEITELDSDWK